MTDVQRARIEPFLPDRTPQRGNRWRDHREVVDAIAQQDGPYTRLLQFLERKALQQRLALHMRQLIARRRAEVDMR